MSATKQKLGPNQKKWYDALIGEKFPQGRGALEGIEGYCCLGVACLVAQDEGVNVVFEGNMLDGGDLSDQISVLDWLGLRTIQGTQASGKNSLVRMNDKEKLSFKQIAKRIKARPETYFSEEK